LMKWLSCSTKRNASNHPLNCPLPPLGLSLLSVELACIGVILPGSPSLGPAQAREPGMITRDRARTQVGKPTSLALVMDLGHVATYHVKEIKLWYSDYLQL
jgi:hypothetical protein